MQIRKCLMLVHLSHAQLLHKELLHFFKLLYFFSHFVDFIVALIDQISVVVSLLVLNHPFRFHFHG